MVEPKKSSIGFGHHPFGQGPFGASDWVGEVLFKRFPAWVREADKQFRGEVEEPLRKFNEAVEPVFEEIQRKVLGFTTLVDADVVPEQNLAGLASNFGIPPSSEEKDIAFRRSEILNQHLLVLRKGFRKGYEIIAGFQGLTVDVDHLWAFDCVDPDTVFTTDQPSSFMAKLDETPADVIPLDKFYSDRLAMWPLRLHPKGIVGSLFFDSTPLDSIPLDSSGQIIDLQCPSHFLDLLFSKPDDTEIENYTFVSRATIRELERMRPIHVEFRKIRFDGPKASAYWEVNLDADSESVAYWEVEVEAFQSVSVYWEVEVDTSLVVN